MSIRHPFIVIALFILLQLGGLSLFYFFGKNIWYPYYEKINSKPTPCPTCKECVMPPPCKVCQKKHIDENLSSWKITPYIPPKPLFSTEKRLNTHLGSAGFTFYPKKLTIIGMKHERKLEVWGELHKKWVLIAIYPFTAFSGQLGPKIEEGDRQIPEGFYKITHLNPNSKFHLSLRLNYPNSFDKKVAKKEKRTGLGGNIMIHGKNRTIGCVPIGDNSIEELYRLVKKVGMSNVKVILAPVDFRRITVNIKKDKHPWLNELYKKLTKEMKKFTSK